MVEQTTQGKTAQRLLSLSVAILLLSSCGNNNENKQTKSNDVKQEKAISEQAAKGNNTGDGKSVEITLLSDDQMKFDTKEIHVRAGQTVKLTLKHTGTMPVTSMGHNFVLLENGINLSEFAQSAAKSKLPHYNIPEELLDLVIAHTKMIGGGETVSIEFEAPRKGTYDFLCSFPGHHGIMKGKFIVE